MKKKTIYILTETIEGLDGIRDFNILGISYKVKKLRKLMKKYIKEDMCDMIKNNGIEMSDKDYFITNFKDSFLEYLIIEKNII